MSIGDSPSRGYVPQMLLVHLHLFPPDVELRLCAERATSVERVRFAERLHLLYHSYCNQVKETSCHSYCWLCYMQQRKPMLPNVPLSWLLRFGMLIQRVVMQICLSYNLLRIRLRTTMPAFSICNDRHLLFVHASASRYGSPGGIEAPPSALPILISISCPFIIRSCCAIFQMLEKDPL